MSRVGPPDDRISPRVIFCWRMAYQTATDARAQTINPLRQGNVARLLRVVDIDFSSAWGAARSRPTSGASGRGAVSGEADNVVPLTA